MTGEPSGLRALIAEWRTEGRELYRVALDGSGMSNLDLVAERFRHLEGRVMLRLADQLEAALDAAERPRECAHGHRTRQVGCVSCVLVFDNQREAAAERPQHDTLRERAESMKRIYESELASNCHSPNVKIFVQGRIQALTDLLREAAAERPLRDGVEEILNEMDYDNTENAVFELDRRLRVLLDETGDGAPSIAEQVAAERPPFDTTPYRLAPSGEGEHAAEWQNKPHRLIYDLCVEIERLTGVTLDPRTKLPRREAAAERPTPETCEWKQSNGWDDTDRWDTTCGEAFCFIDGGPAENRIVFCCYCGKHIVPVPYVEPEEVES